MYPVFTLRGGEGEGWLWMVRTLHKMSGFSTELFFSEITFGKYY